MSNLQILNVGYELTKQLEEKYSVLQNRPLKINIHHPEHQMIIKRFIGQLNEELVEYHLGEEFEKIEETADILNFAMSILLMLDYEYYDIEFYEEVCMFELFVSWNDVAHKLKNRPWKNDQVLTCMETIKPLLKKAFDQTYCFILQNHENPEEIIQAIRNKFQKNLFRLKSNY